jgi:hypothetical protein
MLPGGGARLAGKPGVEVHRLDQLEESKVPFEVKLTFIVSVLLYYPISLCFLLNSKVSVQYWFGYWSLGTAVAVIVWVVFCLVALANGTLRRGLAAIFVIILPSAFLAGMSQVQAWQFTERAASLVTTDCETFEQKAVVQRSWDAALALKTACISSLVNATGASISEISLLTDIEQCPGYHEASAGHERDWAYLAHLEARNHCGGWCTPQQPIWVHQPFVQDSCAFTVASSLSGSISVTSTQIAVYSTVLLACGCFMLLLSPKSLGAEQGAVFRGSGFA